MNPTLPISIFDDEGGETVVNLPARFVICAHCRGTGKSSSYLGAFTSDDLDEAGPEFVEDYFSGAYDRACDDCQGAGKLLEIDEARCTSPEHQRALVYVRDVQEQMDEVRAIERMERLMGA